MDLLTDESNLNILKHGPDQMKNSKYKKQNKYTGNYNDNLLWRFGHLIITHI